MEREEFLKRVEKLTEALRGFGYGVFIEDGSRAVMGDSVVMFIHWDEQVIEITGKDEQGQLKTLRLYGPLP